MIDRDLVIARNAADLAHEEVEYSRTAGFQSEYPNEKLARQIKAKLHTALSNAESKWSSVAKKLPPEEWLSQVERIIDLPTRIQVACTVWWDWFANRVVAERWDSMDEYLRAWKPTTEVDPKKVVKAMHDIGYPKRVVAQRMKQLIEAKKKPQQEIVP